MKRLLIITSLVVAGILNLTAQETQIDLSKYKLPDMKRQTLEFEFDLNNSFNKSFYSFSSMPENESRSYLGSTIRTYYTFYKNSRKWQNELYGQYSLYGYYTDTKEDERLQDERHVGASYMSIQSENRYYLGEYFLGVNPYLNSSYQYNNDVNLNRSRRARLDIYVPVHFGFGRIERVEDARQAAYIYNALKEKARAKEGKTEDDLLMLAEKISQLKNERFFDARNKRIYELEELDKFLKDNGFVDKDDITYFATLSDMWSYGNAPIRRSGFRGSVFANPGYSIMDWFHSESYNTNYKGYVLKTGIKLDYEKPINMYWQYSASMDAYYGLERYRRNFFSFHINSKLPGVNLGLDNSIGYYPNTRTSIRLSSGIQLARYFDESEEGLGSMKGKSLFAYAGLNAYYYFSPQLRVSGILNVYYLANANVQDPDYREVYYVPSYDPSWGNNGNTNTKNNFNYGLSVKFEYFLF